MNERIRILALVHRVPYPPNKGEKIRAYHELKHLFEQGHQIDLCTFADTPEDRALPAELAAMCRRVKIVSKDRRLGRVRSLLELPRGRPLSVGYFHSFRLGSCVKRWIREEPYDVAFCYSSPMAEYVRNGALQRPLVRVMDFVDVDSDKWAQYAEHTQEPMRSIYRLEARRLAAYERQIAEEFDASTLVSEAEAETFRRIAPRAREIASIPNGVDTEFFGRTRRNPSPNDRPVFVFVGQMDYFANVDGVKYFSDEIFPSIRTRIPEARFKIVGRAPTEEVRRLGERPGIEVTGSVPDIRDHLETATLMVAPLRIARGIQNKVLEGMAARVPIVASPAAFEGIRGQHGVHALIAENAERYGAEILRALSEEALMPELSQRARRLVEDEYGWAPAMQKLEDLMLRKVKEHRATPRLTKPGPLI